MFWQRYMGGWGLPAQAGDWGFPAHLWGWIFSFAILDLVLKGFALYRSARREEKVWFVVLLIVNSLGILPLIYLLTHPEPTPKRKK